MGCPIVGTIQDGSGPNFESAYATALSNAQGVAQAMCPRVSEDCPGSDPTPVRIILLDMGHRTINTQTGPQRQFWLKIHFEFRCIHKLGCFGLLLAPFTAARAATTAGADDVKDMDTLIAEYQERRERENGSE